MSVLMTKMLCVHISLSSDGAANMIVIGTGGIDTGLVRSLEGDHGTSPVQGHVLDLIHGIGEGMWNVSRVLCSYPGCCVLILISIFLGILGYLSKLAKIATSGLFMCKCWCQ